MGRKFQSVPFEGTGYVFYILGKVSEVEYLVPYPEGIQLGKDNLNLRNKWQVNLDARKTISEKLGTNVSKSC